MIIVKLSGGLGNQIFQYAFGISLAKSKNVQVLFDKSWYNRNHDRDLGIQNIVEKIEFANKHQIAKILYPKNKLMYFLSSISHVAWKYSPIFITEKKHFEFDSELYKNIPEECYLDGYWQNKSYFKKIQETILNKIKLKEKLDSEHLKYLEQMKNSNSVSVHIRRGDYVKINIDNICNLKYFKKAMKVMGTKIINPTYFIFSDDFNYVSNNFKEGNMFIIPSNLKKPEIDLILMSECKNQITSNSSFSWWSSWLNKNPNKLVITPSKWNNDLMEKSPALSEWIKVDNI